MFGRGQMHCILQSRAHGPESTDAGLLTCHVRIYTRLKMRQPLGRYVSHRKGSGVYIHWTESPLISFSFDVAAPSAALPRFVITHTLVPSKTGQGVPSP